MTPYELHILLKIYTSTPLDRAPILESTLKEMEDKGLIYFSFVLPLTENRITNLGKAFVDDILNTPIPTIIYQGINIRVLHAD